MALGADFHVEILVHGGPGLEDVAAHAGHLDLGVLGMDLGFQSIPPLV